jgi:hypothetical protein
LSLVPFASQPIRLFAFIVHVGTSLTGLTNFSNADADSALSNYPTSDVAQPLGNILRPDLKPDHEPQQLGDGLGNAGVAGNPSPDLAFVNVQETAGTALG